MTSPYSQQDKNRFQALLKVHLKEKERSKSIKEKINLIQKKDRNKWWMLGVNVAAILFFGYSFMFGITQLSNTLLYILLIVFVVNVGLIFYQKKQLGELVEYLQWKKQNTAEAE